MSTGVIFILGKGVNPILASGVKSTWPQGSSAPGFSTLAYNCGPGVVNKSSVLKKLKSGNRDIFKSYTAHCRYKGKFHKQLHQRRIMEYMVLFQK